MSNAKTKTREQPVAERNEWEMNGEGDVKPRSYNAKPIGNDRDLI